MADIIEARRLDLGWSKTEAARRCGFSESEYQSFVGYTKGRGEPSPERLAAISNGMMLEIRDLMAVTGYAPLLDGFTESQATATETLAAAKRSAAGGGRVKDIARGKEQTPPAPGKRAGGGKGY